MYESVPSQAVRQRLSRLLTLDFVRPEADTAFEGPQSWVLCPVVDFNLLVVLGLLPQSVTWHVASNRRWLTTVAAADGLDASVFEPVKEGLQDGSRNSTDLVPDDHVRNVLLVHSFRRPLSLSAPSEQVVTGLGFDPCGPHLFGQVMSRCEDEWVSLLEELNRSCGLATAAAAVQVTQLVAG